MSDKQEDIKLQDALDNFEQIMAYRGDMYTRLADRVRTVVRGGMAMLLLVSIGLFLLLYTLAMEIQHARSSAGVMGKHVTQMAADMKLVQQRMQHMETQMTAMQSISNNMRLMNRDTASMDVTMLQLRQEMLDVNQTMDKVTKRIENLSSDMSDVGVSVNRMNEDVYQISRPTKPFNVVPIP